LTFNPLGVRIGGMNHTPESTLGTAPAFAARVGAEIDLLLRIKRRRKADLAAHLNVSPQTITRRLAGDIPLDLDELESIAAWLGVPVERLTDPAQAITLRERTA
jgi:transcriptional regulator with XRE-family HTH domain